MSCLELVMWSLVCLLVFGTGGVDVRGAGSYNFGGDKKMKVNSARHSFVLILDLPLLFT
jgi:hypothetical protein